MTLKAIMLGLSPEMQTQIVVKSSTQEAWEAIRNVCIDDECTRKSNPKIALMQYERLCSRNSEIVDDFAVQIEGI